MDRIIVYPGGIPLDTDLLNTNRNTMLALHGLLAAALGTGVAVDGLAIGPTSPASLYITVQPGSITQFGPVDSTAYGSIAADTSDAIVKMGTVISPTMLHLLPPTTAGTSIAYLIEATFSEGDQSPVVLPYYNASNPAQPYLGPNNSGVAQNTLRRQTVAVQLKAGAAAATGSQLTPPVDPGWIGLAVVTVNAGATEVDASNIVSIPTTRSVPYKLPDLRPGYSQVQTFTANGTFTVPASVTRVKILAVGGGGAGGTHAALPGGGGGAGGQAMKWLSGLTPGIAIPVTVGAGGAATAAPGNGAPGQTSSFGTFASATGGQGGGGGAGGATPVGGAGGNGFGGDLLFAGAWGGDAIPPSGRGGDGGGPGAGKGGTATVGQNAPLFGWGGGGGGGGASGGTGAAGGSGGGGFVLVEY